MIAVVLFVLACTFCVFGTAFEIHRFGASSSPSLVSRGRIWYAKPQDNRKRSADAMKKAQMYLKMKELREAREKGLDLEEYKAKLKNGTDFTTSRGGSSNGMSKISDDINTEGAEKEYGPKKGYKKFVGSKGSLDSRLRNVIAYKRSSMASNELIRNSDSGMTENEERELDEMMEDD